MKIHTPNDVVASGPMLYGGFESVPIFNLPLFLTRYEASILERKGQVVWNTIALKPSTVLGGRRMSLQIRCYVFDEVRPGTSMAIRIQFDPLDSVYAEYMIDVPLSRSFVDATDGYLTVEGRETVYDAYSHVSYQYDAARHEMVVRLDPPIVLEQQSVYLALTIG